MSLPVSCVICGMQSRDEVQGMIRIARDFTPLTSAEVERLRDTSRTPAAQGTMEAYEDPRSFCGCSYHSAVLKGKA
jgi:hypothetical protein